MRSKTLWRRTVKVSCAAFVRRSSLCHTGSPEWYHHCGSTYVPCSRYARLSIVFAGWSGGFQEGRGALQRCALVSLACVDCPEHDEAGTIGAGSLLVSRLCCSGVRA